METVNKENLSLQDYAAMIKAELEEKGTFPSDTYSRMVDSGVSEKGAYGFICGFMNDLDVPPNQKDIQFLESAKQDIGEKAFNAVMDECRRMTARLRTAKLALEAVTESLIENGCSKQDAMMFINGFLLCDKNK